MQFFFPAFSKGLGMGLNWGITKRQGLIDP